MSAKKRTWPLIKPHTKIETGIRVPVNQRNGRWGLKKSGYAAEEQEKIRWAITKAHPEAPKFWAYAVDINPDNGFVTIGDEEAVNYFNRDNGFLMVKIVSPMPDEYMVIPARYVPNGGCYGFDHVSPRRANGDWVYSLPVHNLVPTDSKTGKKKMFFFLLHFSQNEKGISLEIDKVEVTRGLEHYRLALDQIEEIYDQDPESLVKVAEGTESICDLPIYSALKTYSAFKAKQQA